VAASLASNSGEIRDVDVDQVRDTLRASGAILSMADAT
jgi:hypothetical protein